VRKLLLPFALVATLAFATPAGAITFGQLDGNRHPNVGALFADWDPEVPGPDLLCTGTLISETVFLTASHCTEFLPSVGVEPDEVAVTFDPDASDDNGAVLPGTELLGGTYHTHPDYGGGFSDPHDIGVIVLDEPYTEAEPARLPTLNFLDTLNLKNQRFTAVGYGTVREDKRKGPNALFFDGERRFATQGFHALTKSWLKLNMNPSTGSGGTCYGDSGGPHFLGNTNLLVSITVTGDTPCRATDVTYRTDTASARAFLDDFVDLP
jgi:Trypsin